MWLSQQRREMTRQENVAETGKVTLGGNPAGVYLSGERRDVRVYSPGGYRWTPAPGQDILVLKAGADGESPCAVGLHQNAAPAPGEVCISNAADRAGIHLTQNDTLALYGRITVNGVDLEALIRQIAQTVAAESNKSESEET